jgi:hypothetical protein
MSILKCSFNWNKVSYYKQQNKKKKKAIDILSTEVNA